MKKKVLILCYYYPPNTVIPSWRPYSWASHFAGAGYETHVVCRYWEGTEVTWEDQTNGSPNEKLTVTSPNENYTVHQLPAHKPLKKLLKLIWSNKVTSKLFLFLLYTLGHFQIELDTYFSFRKYIRNTFREDEFDYVLVSSPPLNLIRLGTLFRRYFRKAIFVADFRDLWDNGLLSASYRPGRKTRYFNWLYAAYMKKWLKHYDLATSVCQPILDIVRKTADIRTAVFTNGYEESLFEGLEKNRTGRFVISSVGTIYKNQQYGIVSEGIIRFIRQNPGAEIHVNLVGSKMYNPDFCRRFEEELSATQLTVTGRVSRKEALQYVKDSDVLFYPGWIDFKGMYSGKIFEYLGSHNNVLIAPNDKDVLEALMEETGAGVCRDTAEEVCAQLQDWYDSWKKNGAVAYHGRPERIKAYSRESQARLLEEHLTGMANA